MAGWGAPEHRGRWDALMQFTIPGRPVTKKNSQRILRTASGRPFIAPSKAFMDYQAAAGWYIPSKGKKIDTPVNLQCVYYMPTRHRVDLCNLLEATCDILVHHGLLTDDHSGIVVSHDGSRVRYDKDKPRVEVTITEKERE